MSFTGTREGVFIVARACAFEGCEAVHVARVPFANRFKARASTVRTFVRMQAAADLKRDGWAVREEHSYALDPEPPVWCVEHKAFARTPHEWPTVDQLVAHLAHGGVWQVKTPAGAFRVFTRVHNGVPEIRRENRSEWDVYGLYIARREVTIEPEYRP
jgi:hypothetical protein